MTVSMHPGSKSSVFEKTCARSLKTKNSVVEYKASENVCEKVITRVPRQKLKI